MVKSPTTRAGSPPDAKAEKAARLAAALRANLKRRKIPESKPSEPTEFE